MTKKAVSAAKALGFGVKRLLENSVVARPDQFNKIQSLGYFAGSEYNEGESEFIMAMDRYKIKNKRRFPQFSEVLAVAYSLGYRRVAQPRGLPTFPIKLKERVPSLNKQAPSEQDDILHSFSELATVFAELTAMANGAYDEVPKKEIPVDKILVFGDPSIVDDIQQEFVTCLSAVARANLPALSATTYVESFEWSDKIIADKSADAFLP